MANFLGKLRYRLLVNERTGKYFKYAIGEIFLVVIGILIALQINNWSQSVKEFKAEEQYLINLTSDIEAQLAGIDIQMENERLYYELCSYLIEDYNIDQEFNLDSMFFKRATYLTSRKTFVVTDPTYTDLISSGNIKLIRNSVFKDDLLNYYQELERIERVIQSNNSLLVDDHFISVFQKYGYFYSLPFMDYVVDPDDVPGYVVTANYEMDLEDIAKERLSEFDNKLEFMNGINFRMKIAIGHHVLLQGIKAETKEILESLDKELND